MRESPTLPDDVAYLIQERWDWVYPGCWVLRPPTKGPMKGLTTAIHHYGVSTGQLIRILRRTAQRDERSER